jgi:DNA repair exonuclease SbcCD ATPase subunit
MAALPIVGEDGGEQETEQRLETFARRKKALTKRLANLQTSLDTIHKEEVAVIGGDMDSLVAELGGDEDLREIMDSIVESADEIKGIEQSISNLSAVAEGLEREGADYRARYAAERRVTNKVEQVLEIQKVSLSSVCSSSALFMV